MQRLTKEELQSIDGGGFSKLFVGIATAIAFFIAGIVDGYTRPYNCR